MLQNLTAVQIIIVAFIAAFVQTCLIASNQGSNWLTRALANLIMRKDNKTQVSPWKSFAVWAVAFLVGIGVLLFIDKKRGAAAVAGNAPPELDKMNTESAT